MNEYTHVLACVVSSRDSEENKTIQLSLRYRCQQHYYYENAKGGCGLVST